MEIRVNIPEELSNYIQFLFIDCDSALKLLKFLTSQDTTKIEWINHYTNIYQEKSNKLEIAKSESVNQFCPIGLKVYEYEFDFENHQIIYKNREI